MAFDGMYLVKPGVIRGVIRGPVENKSNSRQIIPTKHGPRIIKNPAAILWVQKVVAAAECSRQRIGLFALDEEKGTRLYLYANVFPDSLRRDLDCELLPDALQEAKIIRNDRSLWHKEYHRMEPDPENPRLEFEVGVVEK